MARTERIRTRLSDGRAGCDRVIADFGAFRDRDEGGAESAGKRTVASRLRRAGCRRSKPCASALLAISCCIDNSRWFDLLDWKACRGAAA